MGKLILLYFGTIFLAFLSQKYNPVNADEIDNEQHFLKRKMDVFVFAIILWLTFFNGLKTAYNDTGSYIRIFRNGATTISGYFEQSGGFDFTDNPLFYLCQTIVKGVTDNYHVWFVLTAAVNAYIITFFYKKYSVSFPFTLLVFYSVGTYVMYIAAIKQGVAVAILMCAIPFLLKHKWVPYYVLVFVAIMFHTHSFMFLILPLFLGKPWGKVTYLCVAAAVFAMATYNTTLGAFMEYAQSIGANVNEVEVFDGHGLNIIRVLVYAVPTLLSFFFRRELFEDSNETENLFVNMTILSCLILSIGLVEGANLFARMAGYFEWAAALSLPWMIGKLFNLRSRQFVYFCAGFLYFIYFLYEFTISKNFGSSYRAISIAEFLETLF